MASITEHRSWSVTCRRRIVAECYEQGEVTADETTHSASAAEAEFRAQGWTLHADDTATCPTCNDVWSGRYPLAVVGHIVHPADTDPADDRDPDGMRPGDVVDVDDSAPATSGPTIGNDFEVATPLDDPDDTAEDDGTADD